MRYGQMFHLGSAQSASEENATYLCCLVLVNCASSCPGNGWTHVRSDDQKSMFVLVQNTTALFSQMYLGLNLFHPTESREANSFPVVKLSRDIPTLATDVITHPNMDFMAAVTTSKEFAPIMRSNDEHGWCKAVDILSLLAKSPEQLSSTKSLTNSRCYHSPTSVGQFGIGALSAVFLMLFVVLACNMWQEVKKLEELKGKFDWTWQSIWNLLTQDMDVQLVFVKSAKDSEYRTKYNKEKRELEKTKDKLHESENMTRSKQSEIDDMARKHSLEIDEAKSHARSVEATSKELNSKIEDDEKCISELNSKLDEAQQISEQLQVRIKSLETNNERVVASQNDLLKQIALVEASETKLSSENCRLKAEVESLSAEKVRLKSEATSDDLSSASTCDAQMAQPNHMVYHQGFMHSDFAAYNYGGAQYAAHMHGYHQCSPPQQFYGAGYYANCGPRA